MSRSLLGIALVVDDIHKGCNLAFRYPAPPTSMDHVSSFHKLSASLIAKLFRPKNALCNQSFELVIDDLRFISHPVLVPRRTSNRNELPLISTCSTSVSSTDTTTGITETTMFNVIFALDDSLINDTGTSSSGDERRFNIASFRTVAAQLANGFLHEELRVGFVTREVRELLHIRDELVQNERMMGAGSGNGSGNVTINTTSSTNTGSGTTVNGGATSNSGGSSGKDITNSNTSGIPTSGGSGNTTSSSGENGHRSVEVDPQTLIDVSLGKSVLANDLKSVYHGLEEYETAHVMINHWVKLDLTLSDVGSLQLHQFRPYQTVLLLKETSIILDALPKDHSQQLRLLIEAANPLHSFQDLSLTLSIPLPHLFRLALHLVYWGYARIIDTINMHSIYQVHPKCSLRAESALALEFRRKFSPHELCEVLATFSGARRMGEYVKSLSSTSKIEYIHMLVSILIASV